MQLFDHVKSVLSQNASFCIDGKLFKNNIVEAALKLDTELLSILLKDDTTKKHFFTSVEKIQIFDKVKFQQFVSNKLFLPDSYTTFKNKIGLTANGDYLTEANEIVLAFPYKDCVLEGGQTKEDQKRKEIFWNETLASDEIDRLFETKVLTNWKRFDDKGEKELKTIDYTKDSFLIKGNNLLVLYSLKACFKEQVKLIYIDPPYNTGNDGFNYNDKFNHSAWLTFMKNRLSVARELLTKDGTIFINIDDKEYSYLKIVCDEIFGRENFLNVFSVKTSDPSGHKTVNPSPYSQTEYILLYAKNKSAYKYETQYVASEYDKGYNKLITNFNEDYTAWETVGLFDYLAKENGYKDTRDANKQLGKETFSSVVAKYALENKERIYQPVAIADDAAQEIVQVRDKSKDNLGQIYKVVRDNGDVYIQDGRQIYFYASKVREIDGVETPSKPLTNLWADIPYNGISKEGGVKLKNGKKPEKLLRRIIEISTQKNDLVLDFHLGSGTTCAVAHKLGRRYIGVEQLDYGDNDSVIRLQNVIKGDSSGISKIVNWNGGGSFVYADLAENAASYISKIEAIKDSKEAVELWNQLKAEPFISYRVSPNEFDADIDSFEQLQLDNQKQLLLATIDKNHLYINYADIEDKTYNISDADKKLNLQFYNR